MAAKVAELQGRVTELTKQKQKLLQRVAALEKKNRVFQHAPGNKKLVSKILSELRWVQEQTGCSTRTLNLVLQRLKPFLKGCESLERLQMKRVWRETKVKRRLHGCIGCNDHVYGPTAKEAFCPRCAYPRYDSFGNPHEVCWYFPLEEQFRRLLECESYVKHLMYEQKHIAMRRTDDDFMCDIYDSPRWQKLAGPIGTQLTRIVLVMCVDGVPAFNKMQSKNVGSVKPLNYFVANLPPTLRYNHKYMLVHALIPSRLKGKAAKKYYDWLGENEMNKLFRTGVDGVRVLLYGDTADTPGRRELLAMQAVSAFYPCPHCLHCWQPGLRKQIYGGYRCFLPQNSEWRMARFRFRGLLYQFRDQEERPTPLLRNDKNVRPKLCIFSVLYFCFCFSVT